MKSELFDDTGNIDKSELGNLVFFKQGQAQEVRKNSSSRNLENTKKFVFDNSKSRVVFFDIPLLFEKGLQKSMIILFTLTSHIKFRKKEF